MTESESFRRYANEAMRGSSKAANENEKQTLIDLASIWTQAASMSEKMFGSTFVSPPCDDDEAKAPPRS
jgi:hypothetical protein